MKFFSNTVLSLMLVLLASCSGSEPVNSESTASLYPLKVYKTPTCGCCGKWVSHIEDFGFDTTIKNQNSLDRIKKRLNIPSKLQSCHTGVSKDGFFFEGHIPAKFIQIFLSNPPKDALGLAVPGMPTGTPGMEMGDSFSPYQIFLVKFAQKGEVVSEVYAEILTKEDQF